MKSALYHQTGKPPLACEIVKTHGNKTVDLAVDGVVKITECEVSKGGAPGTCTLVESEDPHKAAKAAASSLRKKATEAAKAAVNARKAADAAKGKPNEADLIKAAEEADAAAEHADTEADNAEAALKE